MEPQWTRNESTSVPYGERALIATGPELSRYCCHCIKFCSLIGFAWNYEGAIFWNTNRICSKIISILRTLLRTLLCTCGDLSPSLLLEETGRHKYSNCFSYWNNFNLQLKWLDIPASTVVEKTNPKLQNPFHVWSEWTDFHQTCTLYIPKSALLGLA